jgi:demethylmacrocin O-methyltransferase
VKPYFDTDKIYQHGYFPAYAEIAARLGPSARVCEIGVAAGESLRMWQSLFPLGEVTGVDIHPEAVFPAGTRRVIAGQDDPCLAELGPFDLIVDDASHDGNLTRETFALLWPRLAPGGFYVVEDWFIGIEPYFNGAFDPVLLETVQGFLRLLTRDGDCESVNCRYGMAVLRKKPASP